MMQPSSARTTSFLAVPFLTGTLIAWNEIGKMISRCRAAKQRLVGYARVSTSDQELSLQMDALLLHGVKRENIFCDRISGAKADRPGLALCQERLHRGDTLVVWRLDRLGRSMRHLVTLIEDLRERGIAFRSICDGVIDTTSASGELVFNIFSSLAQFERRLIQERTRAGLAAARAGGRNGGRPPLDPNEPRVILARKLFRDKSNSIEDICTTLKISRTTLYRYARLADATPADPGNATD